MLKTLIFAVFLGISVTAMARQAEIGASDGTPSPEITTNVETTENSDFSLFQHGIWPQARASRDIATQPLVIEDPKPEPKKHTLKQIGRKAAERRAIYLPAIRAAERRHALPFGLLDALIWAESRYNPVAISSAGARGLTQLMPGTASDLGVRNRFDPLANINGGARYLKQMLNQFGVIHLALAAYNAGPSAVARANGIPKNRETPRYVKTVLARWTESHR